MSKKEKKMYKKVVKVCKRIIRRHGLEAAWVNLRLNLNNGTCTLAEYNWARNYLRKVSDEQSASLCEG